jgi:hypothetical protein
MASGQVSCHLNNVADSVSKRQSFCMSQKYLICNVCSWLKLEIADTATFLLVRDFGRSIQGESSVPTPLSNT